MNWTELNWTEMPVHLRCMDCTKRTTWQLSSFHFMFSESPLMCYLEWELLLTHQVTHQVQLHPLWTYSSHHCSYRSEVVQLIGLVDYPSLKKSIWCRRLLSRRPLNALTDVPSTSSCDKLFQRLMTRCCPLLVAYLFLQRWFCFTSYFLFYVNIDKYTGAARWPIKLRWTCCTTCCTTSVQQIYSKSK